MVGPNPIEVKFKNMLMEGIAFDSNGLNQHMSGHGEFRDPNSWKECERPLRGFDRTVDHVILSTDREWDRRNLQSRWPNWGPCVQLFSWLLRISSGFGSHKATSPHHNMSAKWVTMNDI